MKTAKEEAIDLINTLPDDASLEDIERCLRDRVQGDASASEDAQWGQAGRKLAAHVWEQEDFSDWER